MIKTEVHTEEMMIEVMVEIIEEEAMKEVVLIDKVVAAVDIMLVVVIKEENLNLEETNNLNQDIAEVEAVTPETKEEDDL